MTIEDLLNETGGLGKFQVALITCLFANKFFAAWSMLQMSFAGFVPNWHCLGLNLTEPENETLNMCSRDNNITDGNDACDGYHFLGSARTIITEMAGVMVGALVAGQMGDYLGRKKTTYLFVLEHGVSNIVAAFSISWQMFAVCRFFIGFGIGAIMVVIFPYPMEFTPVRWRPILSVTPVWAMGTSALALTAVLTNDWSHIHLACGVIALTALLGYFFIPESLRWLTVHGRVIEAEQIVRQIAKMNKKAVPAKTAVILQEVADEERKSRETGQKYTYVDVFRGWQTARITLIFCYHWFMLSVVYYGISFGVTSLSGNLQLNIFLLAVVELPAVFATFCCSNKIGRKWTSVIFISITMLSAVACLVVELHGPQELKGNIILGLSLAAKMGCGAAWAALQTWGTELYPTVTRNLGYGAANAASRVGGIVAPFVINFEDMMVVSYVVIGCLSLGSILLMLVTPETMGTELPDSLKSTDDKGGFVDMDFPSTTEYTNGNPGEISRK